MKYKIIEDCSPYYIRFTHDGLENIIEYCKENIPEVVDTFTHFKFSIRQGKHLLSLVPMSEKLKFRIERVSLFITKSGRYYRAHKDGLNDRFSINYTVKILDNDCMTNWYSDNDLEDYPIDNLLNRSSRECLGFVKENHTPIKSMIAQPNECILFNTDMFHDFDNSNSKNIRVILTLRLIQPLSEKTYFEDAKKILFN